MKKLLLILLVVYGCSKDEPCGNVTAKRYNPTLYKFYVTVNNQEHEISLTEWNNTKIGDTKCF